MNKAFSISHPQEYQILHPHQYYDLVEVLNKENFSRALLSINTGH